MSVSNLMENMTKFREFCNNYSISLPSDVPFKKLFYNMMSEIHKSNPNASCESLNSMMQNVARDYFTKTNDVFPNRQVPTMMIPPPSNVRTKETQFTLEKYDGNDFMQITPDPDPKLTSITEVAPDAATTDNMLKNFQKYRDGLMPTSNTISDENDTEYMVPNITTPEVSPSISEMTRWICINGADRDIKLYPFRCNFRTNLQEQVRNVKNIRVNFVQIPMETNKNIPNQNVYNYPLDVAFPYIHLIIDELRPTYIGTSDVIRRSFCILTYVRNCITNNFRGYTTYVSQNECLSFNDSPLSQLSSLTIQLRYPNGELVNQARDTYHVSQLSILPATNPTASTYGGLLRVGLETNADSNEFVVNDNVRIGALHTIENHASSQQMDHLKKYLSQEIGHNIIGVDTTAQQGKIVGVFIKLPGDLNDKTASWNNHPDILKLFVDIPIIKLKQTPIWNTNLQIAVGMQVTSTTVQSNMWNTATITG